MTPETNKKLVHKAFHALNEGSIEEWLGYFDDDIVWKAIPGTPLPARMEGKAVLRAALLGPFLERIPGGVKIHFEEYIAEGDRVVAIGRGEAWSRDGRPYNQHYVFIFRVRSGKIVEVDERYDTALVNAIFR